MFYLAVQPRLDTLRLTHSSVLWLPVCALVLVIRRYISFRHLGGEVVSPSSLLVAFSEVDVGLACRVVLFASYVGLAFG